MENIVLQKNEMLVTPIVDYYGTTKKDGGFDSTISENQNVDIGVIEHAGKDLPKEWVGKVIYYTKGMGTKVLIKGVGNFQLVPDDFRKLIRMDQDKNNY